MKRFKIKERNFLEQKLSKCLPRILEVNLISKELKRNVFFTVKLPYYYFDNYDIQSGEDKLKKKKILVQVNNKEENQIYLWSLSKFNNRYFIIKDVLDRYFEANQVYVPLSKEDDVKYLFIKKTINHINDIKLRI